jgi:hypothetical protein
MNGTPGRRVCHGRGLHQGDLLSPMLFLLVMEVLSALIKKADDWALFNQLGSMPLLIAHLSMWMI